MKSKNIFYSCETLDEFINFINKGGNLVSSYRNFKWNDFTEIKDFLSKIEKNKIIPMVTITNKIYNFSSFNIYDEDCYSLILKYFYDIESENKYITNKYADIFEICILWMDDEEKNKSLEWLLNDNCSNFTNWDKDKFDPKKGKSKFGKYVHIDYAENENGEVINWSTAMFRYNDFLIRVTIRGDEAKNPWNEKYLDYFDLKMVEINKYK